MRLPNSNLWRSGILRCIFVECLAFGGTLQGTGSIARDTPQQKDARAIVRLLESRYQAATTWKAAFLERYSEGSRDIRVESGTAYFRHPGRMRWEYEAPEKKLFVADGKTVWFYVPADSTVTRAAMKESADWRTPLALLTGKTKLDRLCGSIQLLSGNQMDVATLRCLPRSKGADANRGQAKSGDRAVFDSDAPFDEILLRVNPTTGELIDVVIRQGAGIELEFRFGNWQRNVALSEDMFRFRAPPGVAIVDESPMGGGAGR